MELLYREGREGIRKEGSDRSRGVQSPQEHHLRAGTPTEGRLLENELESRERLSIMDPYQVFHSVHPVGVFSPLLVLFLIVFWFGIVVQIGHAEWSRLLWQLIVDVVRGRRGVE